MSSLWLSRGQSCIPLVCHNEAVVIMSLVMYCNNLFSLEWEFYQTQDTLYMVLLR